ncbi:MAG: acyltransferase [Rhizobiaceae bacterium]|nr:acyltransferase [Rhizobiaceae bacterium]
MGHRRLAGLALLVASNVLAAAGDPFPGVIAIPPVVATALLIAAGFAAPNSVATRLLAVRPLVFVGLVSYGWYLWHWPLISFARIADFDEPSMLRDVAMAIVSFGLAALTYRFVERPARQWRERRGLAGTAPKVVRLGLLASLAVALLAGGVGAGAYLWSSRLPAIDGDVGAFRQETACPASVCRSSAGRRGILLGDSHADRLLDELGRETAQLGMTLDRSGSLPDASYDFAVLAYRWNLYVDGRTETSVAAFERRMESQLTRLSDGGRVRILVFGPVPEFPKRGAECTLRSDRYGTPRDTHCAVSRASVEARRARTMEILRRLAAKVPGVRLVDPLDLFCDAALCRPYSGGRVVTTDKDHLSVPYGASWFLHAYRDDLWWVLANPAE